MVKLVEKSSDEPVTARQNRMEVVGVWHKTEKTEGMCVFVCVFVCVCACVSVCV